MPGYPVEEPDSVIRIKLGELVMSTVQLYLDATIGVATMTILGFASGVIAVALTGDLRLALLSAGAVFILTGAGLVVRLWRVTRPVLPRDPSL